MTFAALFRAAVLAPAALALAALTAPAQAEPVTFATATDEVTLDAAPERIVALDVAAIDTLAALGITPSGIVSPLFVDYLDGLEGAAQVGTLFEPDFEAIAALSPDLIVVGGRSVAQAAPLARIAPVADMSIGPDALADGKARLEAYGTLTGRGAQAAEIAAALDAKLEQARALATAQGGRALIVMTNGPKLSAFGPGSRFGWLHNAVGFEPADPGIDTANHGEAVSFEYIAERDPDTLLVIDRGAAVGEGNEAAQATLDNPLVNGTKAAREGRIIYLSPAPLYIAGGGVQALSITLDEIIAAFGGA